MSRMRVSGRVRLGVAVVCAASAVLVAVSASTAKVAGVAHVDVSAHVLAAAAPDSARWTGASSPRTA